LQKQNVNTRLQKLKRRQYTIFAVIELISLQKKVGSVKVVFEIKLLFHETSSDTMLTESKLTQKRYEHKKEGG